MTASAPFLVVEVVSFAASQDPAKPVKARLAANPVAGFSKVISLTKLKKKYGQFQEKRELCASYDAFFADERILPSLSKVLGKVRAWHLCIATELAARPCACLIVTDVLFKEETAHPCSDWRGMSAHVALTLTALTSCLLVLLSQHADLTAVLSRARDSTCFYMPFGSCA